MKATLEGSVVTVFILQIRKPKIQQLGNCPKIKVKLSSIINLYISKSQFLVFVFVFQGNLSG